MKWIANIKKIGKKAVDNKDGMVILFGEGANKDLEDVSVIQNSVLRRQLVVLFLKRRYNHC